MPKPARALPIARLPHCRFCTIRYRSGLWHREFVHDKARYSAEESIEENVVFQEIYVTRKIYNVNKGVETTTRELLWRMKAPELKNN